jgi:hypothetical protein
VCGCLPTVHQRKLGIPTRDLVWWSSFVFTAIQLGISAILYGLYNAWGIFLITACGTLLAYAFSMLPRLTYLRYNCRRRCLVSASWCKTSFRASRTPNYVRVLGLHYVAGKLAFPFGGCASDKVSLDGRELYLLLQRLPPVIVGVLPSGQACYVKGKKPAEQTRARTVPPIDNNVKGDNLLRKAEWSKFKRGREDH